MKMGVQVVFFHHFIILNIYSVMSLLNHMVVLILCFRVFLLLFHESVLLYNI